MPKTTGNAKSNSKNSKDWQQFDFVEVRLNEEEKTDFKKRYSSEADKLLGMVDEIVKNGYKISSSYDTTNNCIIVALTCKEPNSPNFNYVMTSRAGEVWEATALAMYKHYFCCDDEDWGSETRINDRQWG